MMRIQSLLFIFLVCLSVTLQQASENQSYSVSLSSKEELEQDFQQAGLSDFANKTGIIGHVQGRTFQDIALWHIVIRAQIAYDQYQNGVIFQQANQRNVYAILFKNNLNIFEQFKNAGMI